MSFPAVGLIATVAITTQGAFAGVFFMASRSQSRSSTKVACIALGVLHATVSGGFASAYMRSDDKTTPQQYVQNGLFDTSEIWAKIFIK